MKNDIHPTDYRLVVIQDTSNGDSFLIRSTAQTDETIKWEDGQVYPLVKIHVSATSHPFYTGKEKMVDIEGRVDKFKARRATSEKLQAERAKVNKKKTAGKTTSKSNSESTAARPQKLGDATGAKPQEESANSRVELKEPAKES